MTARKKGKKKREIVVREKNEIRVVLSNFLVGLTETKFVGCSCCKKKSLVVFKEQPEYTSNRSRMYFSDRTYILDWLLILLIPVFHIPQYLLGNSVWLSKIDLVHCVCKNKAYLADTCNGILLITTTTTPVSTISSTSQTTISYTSWTSKWCTTSKRTTFTWITNTLSIHRVT